MKSASIVLSVTALLGCGILWIQNQSLRSALSELETSLEELKSESSSVSTRAPAEKKLMGRERGSARVEIGGRLKTEKESKPSQELMEEKFQQGNERIVGAIKDFGDEKQLDSEKVEELIGLVIENLASQHEVRKAIATGEVSREDGRSEVMALRESQKNDLNEVLGVEKAEELVSAIRAARLPPTRDR